MERRPETISFYRERLPHWSVRDALYFVTIRQKNSIPADAAMRIREKILDLESYSEDERIILRRKILVEMEKWLDRPSVEGILTKGDAPAIIKEAIQFRIDNGTWRMVEYVIMPNHLHLFFSINKGSLKALISGFKRKTSVEIGKNLGTIGQALWHREWFDHWSRSAEQDEKIKRYIRLNPVKAGLVKDFKDWQFGSWD